MSITTLMTVSYDLDSDLDPDVVIVDDDNVHTLEVKDNETEMVNDEHSIITEKVLDVSTNLENQCEVSSTLFLSSPQQ